MYPPQPSQQPYPQPDPNQQGYAPPPNAQPPYAQPPSGQGAYGFPPNPYAPPSTPMQPPYAAPQPPNPYYAPPSMPMQPPPPMQQPMYYAPPPMPASGSLDFNAFTLSQNRGSLFAAIGGVVALLSFFLFDFWGVSGDGISFNFKASDLASGHFGSIPLGHSYPLLWLVPVAALVAAAVAVIIVLGIRSIQGLTSRNAAVSITSASAVGIVCLLISVLQFNGDLGSSQSSATAGISYGYGFGFWLTLLALIAALIGGILNLRQMQPAYMQPPPYMGGGYPPQMPPMQ